MAEEVDTVWEATVDGGAWHVRVDRTEAYKGELIIVRRRDGKQVLREEVGLAYQAVFGADVDDVRSWQQRAIQVIDSPEANE